MHVYTRSSTIICARRVPPYPVRAQASAPAHPADSADTAATTAALQSNVYLNTDSSSPRDTFVSPDEMRTVILNMAGDEPVPALDDIGVVEMRYGDLDAPLRQNRNRTALPGPRSDDAVASCSRKNTCIALTAAPRGGLVDIVSPLSWVTPEQGGSKQPPRPPGAASVQGARQDSDGCSPLEHPAAQQTPGQGADFSPGLQRCKEQAIWHSCKGPRGLGTYAPPQFTDLEKQAGGMSYVMRPHGGSMVTCDGNLQFSEPLADHTSVESTFAVDWPPNPTGDTEDVAPSVFGPLFNSMLVLSQPSRYKRILDCGNELVLQTAGACSPVRPCSCHAICIMSHPAGCMQPHNHLP
jgi:hypothetical protein